MTDDSITLRNRAGSRAWLSAVGCAVMSLEIAGTDGGCTDVVLGYDTSQGYLDDPFYLGVVVGRCAGRIEDGVLALNGTPVQLPVGEGGHHLHGGALGFGKRRWEVRDVSPDRVAFYRSSPHGEEGYPGRVDIQVDYHLADDNVLEVRYLANSDRRTLLSPAQHSYFNLAGHDSGDILGHELMLRADSFVPLRPDLIPRGGTLPVDNTAMDFRAPRRIGDRIDGGDEQLDLAGGYDHSWVRGSDDDWENTPAAVVREPGSGHTLEVYTDRPALHFYSGNMLDDGLTGKAGAIYSRCQGFCLETQHVPGSPLAVEPLLLEPGATFESETRFAFSGF